MTNKTAVKHTPGPWSHHVSPQHQGAIINGAGSHYVGTVNAQDANLISASPELLEAAKMAEDYLRNHCFRTGTGTREDRTFEKLVAAIAKAQGVK